MNTLSYFDPMNLAEWVRCPTLVGVGRQDDIVPAETVYAIANHLTCHHEVREFPVSHSNVPEEALWERFEEEWVKMAVEGVRANFGVSHRRVIS